MLSTSPSSPSHPRTTLAAVCALLAGAIFLAYSSALDNFFFPLDDPLLLWSSARGIEATPHFRPLYSPWNGLLWTLFGLEPAGRYLAGMLGHWIGSILVVVLVQRLTGRWLQAAVTGVVFALFYGSHEVVLWIAANSTLLSVVPLVAAGIAWDVFLTTGGDRPIHRASAYVAALGFLVVSAGFKEDCVLAAPLFLGLDLLRNGWRGVLSVKAQLRYAPLAIFAATYLGLAFHPSLWADLPTVGRYEFHLALIPELFCNFAWLAWPRKLDTGGWTVTSVEIGLTMAVGIALAGWYWRRREPLLLLGLFIALLGMLPALPGPFPVAGSRYGYAGSIGAALMIGAGFGLLWKWRSGTGFRTLLVVTLLGWVAANGWSIHSTEQWRFGINCARLEKMVETSGPVAERAGSVVINPAVPNAHDYLYALLIWHGLERENVTTEMAPHGPQLFARLEPGGDLDPTVHAVYGCRGNGEVFRLHSPADALVEQWAAEASRREWYGKGHNVALVRVTSIPGGK